MLCLLCAVSIEVGALRINQNLFGNIKFQMNAISLGSTVWYKDFGLKVLMAKSSETENSINLDKKYTNKIDNLYSVMALYKYQINDNFSFISGVGYTTYQTSWEVNGVKPEGWATDTDSDISYHGAIRYTLDDNYSFDIGYSDFYKKNKVGFGKETTRGINASFIYKF